MRDLVGMIRLDQLAMRLADRVKAGRFVQLEHREGSSYFGRQLAAGPLHRPGPGRGGAIVRGDHQEYGTGRGRLDSSVAGAAVGAAIDGCFESELDTKGHPAFDAGEGNIGRVGGAFVAANGFLHQLGNRDPLVVPTPSHQPARVDPALAQKPLDLVERDPVRSGNLAGVFPQEKESSQITHVVEGCGLNHEGFPRESRTCSKLWKASSIRPSRLHTPPLRRWAVFRVGSAAIASLYAASASSSRPSCSRALPFQRWVSALAGAAAAARASFSKASSARPALSRACPFSSNSSTSGDSCRADLLRSPKGLTPLPRPRAEAASLSNCRI